MARPEVGRNGAVEPRKENGEGEGARHYTHMKEADRRAGWNMTRESAGDMMVAVTGKAEVSGAPPYQTVLS